MQLHKHSHREKKQKKALLSQKITLSQRDFICHSLCLSKTNKRISLQKQISCTRNLHNELFSSSTCIFPYNRSRCGWQWTLSFYNALGENPNSRRLGPTSPPPLTGAWQPWCPGHAAVPSPLLLGGLTLCLPATGQPLRLVQSSIHLLPMSFVSWEVSSFFAFWILQFASRLLYTLLSSPLYSFFRFLYLHNISEMASLIYGFLLAILSPHFYFHIQINKHQSQTFFSFFSNFILPSPVPVLSQILLCCLWFFPFLFTFFPW